VRLPAILIGALLVGAGAAHAQQFPTTPPAPAPLAAADFPPHHEAELPNGMRMLVVERRAHPVVSVSLVLPAGASHDPAGKSGLASMTAGLLTKGAAGRTAEQVSEAIERVGGTIGSGANPDFLVVRAGVLRDDAELAFTLVGEAVRDPAFAPGELEMIRNQSIQGLQFSLSTPEGIATRVLNRRLYGEHPYAADATPASLRSITREDLLAFQRDRLKPAGALLVIAGDISLADARALALRAFGEWTGAPAPAATSAAPPRRAASEILLVDRPGSVQANVVIGNLTTGPADDGRHAAIVANRVLGTGSQGRLFRILREQYGWTYGSYSYLNWRRGVGSFRATAEVRTEAADSALAELLTQLRRIGSEPVTDVELEGARSAIVGSFPLSVQTADQIADQVADAILLGLPQDYLSSYRTRIAAVTPAHMQAAARSLIRPDEAVIVVVGDAGRLRPALERIGPVTLVTAEGEPVATAAAGPAAALTLHLDRLEARSDSFVVMVQGNAMGHQRGALTRDDGGWRYVEETQIATFVRQNTELQMDARARPVRLRQTGTVQGQETELSVEFAGGRATGSGRVPGPQGMRDVNVDAAIGVDVLENNVLSALVPALDWKPGARITLELFDAGQGVVQNVTLTAGAAERVTVPAGEFDAWTVEVSGMQTPVTFWVTTSAPHRVVKMAPAGAPIELVLAK
jgi:zinc protease